MTDAKEVVAQTQEEIVRDNILNLKEPKIEIIKPEDIEGFTFSLPNRDDYMKKLGKSYPNYPEIPFITDHFFSFLDTSVIVYPPKPEDVTLTKHIDDVDDAILSNFEGDERDIAHKITLDNRLKVNHLINVESSIGLAAMIFDKDAVSNELTDILNYIEALANPEVYKEGRTYEEKIEIAKKFSKAAEMTIRLLGGDTLSKEDFKTLSNLAPYDRGAIFTNRVRS